MTLGSGTLTVGDSSSATFGGVLSGTGGSLVKQGSGALTLSGANTYTGTTTISQGTLIASSIVVSGGSSSLGNATSPVVLGDGIHQGLLSYTGSSATYTRGFTINAGGGEIDVTNSGQTVTVTTGAIGDSGPLTIGGAGSTSISVAISGTVALTKVGTGTLTLGASNSYSGTTRITAGTLVLNSPLALQSSTLDLNSTDSGSLSFGSLTTATFAGLTGSRNLILQNATSAAVALTVGNGVADTSYSGVLSGAGSLIKVGSNTLTLSANQSYTGPTTAQAGRLNVLGNLSSHVTVTGGTVIGLIFYDPDLAAAVRQALGMSVNTVLTAANVSPLTSLSVDSNRVTTLQGLQYATNLESLTLLPGDFSSNASYEHLPSTSSSTSPLAPLSGLTHLTTLILQDCGLNDTALTTSVSLPSLQSLDIRYNSISTVPSWIASLSGFTSLLVYGNTALTSNPRIGLANLAGKLINVDVAPDHPEAATTIADLAASLYHLPIAMYQYVTNTIEFQPYTGAMKGALAVLQTGGGNDWDTDSLLAELFQDAGVSTQHISRISGRVTVSDQTAEDYLGVTNASAAVAVLDAAGLEPTTGTGTITFDHAWLQVTFGSTTVKLDPAWKFCDFQPGMGDMLASQSFDLDDYLSTVTKETAGEYYEQQVRDYLAANDPSKTIADVPHTGPIHQQTITSLLTDLPYQHTQGTVVTTVPEHQIQISMVIPCWTYVGGSWHWDHITGTYDAGSNTTTLSAEKWNGSDWVEDSGVFSYGSVGTKVYIDFSNTGTWQNAQAFNVVSWNSLSSITVSGNAPATDAQFYITGVSELYGVPDISLDKVTLGYVGTSNSLTPDLRLTDTTGESTDVYGNKTLPNGAPVNIIITYYQPTSSGSTQRYSTTYPRYAGDYAAIGIDAGQWSDRWIVAARKTLNDAEVAKSDNPGSAIQDDSIVRGLLSLAVADYFHQTDQEEAIIDGLTGAVPVYNFVASCLASSASTLQTADFSQQLPYLPASMSIDVQNNFCDAVAINGSDPSAVTRFNQVGYNDSAAESALWEELTNIPSASTVKAIQYANQNGIDIAPFGPGSTRQQIYDQFSLISDTNFRNGLADSIHSYCQAGYSVDSPTQIMSFGNDQSQPWTGVGFTVADSAGRVLAYMIYGGVSGSSQYATVSGGAAVGPPSIVYDVVSAVVSLLATDPVNTANGDVVYQATDFSIPNLGVPLTFARQYDSFNTVSGLAGAPSPWSDRGMGEGWSFSFSDTLTTSTDVNDPSGTKVWFASDGVQYKFVPNGGGYNTPKTLFGTLVFNGSGQGYTWTDKNDNVIHFDDSGKLRYEWDVYGNGVDIAYDGNGCITTVSDHVNSSRHLTFTYTSGHITSIVDFNGRTWTYRYTGGQLTQVTTPTDVNTPQGSTAYGYYSDDAQRNLLKSVLDADGNTTTFEYYSNRYGFRVIDADGGAYSLSYNLFRNRTALTCALGSTGYYSYDVDTGHALLTERLYADRTTNTYQWTDGLMTSDTDAYGQTQSYTYYNDGTGDLHTYTDRGNNVTTYTYTADVYHNIASIATTGPNGNVVTTFTYNANSGKSLTDVTEDSSGLALHTTFTYQGSAGARGLPDTMTSPNGYLTSGDPNDYKTTYTYNIAGDVLTESYRVSSTHSITEQYGYDNWGNLTSYTDGNGKVTSYTYDLLDRVKTETDPDPDGTGGLPAPHVTYAYNGNGDLIQKSVDTAGTTPLVTTITYDAMENVTGVTNPDGTYTSYAYDQGENLVRQTDELGRATRYLYDRRYRQIATIAPDGGVWRTSYDGGNRVVAETDALGNTTRYEYDVLGQLTEVVSPDPDGNGSLTSLITLYGYYNDGSLRYVTDTHADVNGNPVASLGDANYTTEYHYDNLGQLTQEIDADPDGNGSLGRPTTYYGYDADGNLAWTTDARGSAAQDPDHTTTYNYDEAGRLIRVNVPDPNGASGDKLTTRYFYDDNGNVTDVVDPRGTDAKEAAYTTHYVYDALGRLTQEVDPDPDDFSNVGGSNGPQTRPSTSYAYDAYGNLASVTDPLTHTTSYQYDKLGQCTAVTDALGDTNSVLYDAAGNVLWSKDALGAITFYQYDAADQMVSVTLPAANADTSAATTTYQYDLNGNLTSATDALEHTTTYQYDRLGRRTQVTSPNTGSNTSVTQYAYDSQGRLLSTTDGLSYATTYAYDNLNRLTSETDALNGVTSYTYDANGNTLSVEDPDGNTTEYAYDSLNRVTDSLDRGASESDPLALTRQYQYDDIGNVTQYTDRDFRVTKYQYDNLGRETGEQWMSGATVVHSFSYAYDALGRLLSGSDNDPTYGSTDSYVYNALGQVTSETQAIDGLTPSVTLSRQYDANGRQTQLSAAIGSTSDFVNDYAYDRLGELAQVKQHGATVGDAVAEKRVDFTYNAVGQFSTIARYNALAGGSGNEVATSVYGYDAAGRLTSLTHTHGSTTLAGYEWTYDAANRMTEMKSKADATAGNDWGVVDYTYDATDQLKTATYSTWANAPSNENYGYDANGNRNTGGNTVQSTGDNRQATDSAGYTYSYDNEGNRVARFIDANANGVIDSGDSEITTYQWDYRNRLTEVEYFASAANYGAATPISDLVVSYTYDYANRLIKEVVDSDGTSGSTAVKQTVFAYDGIEAVLQFEKTGTGALAGSNLSDRYLWGPAIDQILTDEQVTSLGTAGTNLWGLADHEGTVRDILDNSGSVTDHRVFDSFGKMTSHTGSADFDIGYAGMFYDSGSGMNRTLFRLYDPAVGRWANQDPLGLAAGPNPYAYCGNSPMTHTDPIGLKTPTIGSLSDGSTDADVQAVIRGILDSEHPSAGLRIMSGAYFLQNEEHAREQLPDAYRGAATLPANDLAGARYFIFPRFISRDLKSTLVYLRKAYDEQHLPGPVVMEFGGHAYGMGGFSIGAKSRQQLKGVKDVQHYVDETNAAEFAQALLSAGFHPRVIILSSCNLNPKIAQIIADKTGATVIYARGFAKGSFVEDGVGASSTKRYDKTRETLRENTTSEIAKIENKLKERGLSKEDRDSLVRERNDLKNRLKTLIKDSEAGWGIARPREKGTTKPDNRTDKQSLTRPTVFQTAGCY
ncbi:MAG: autotransporter-associated beta strand repeat-containing protein [Planctomycetaceae bacterium]|nr:autotransporter-associated beta strand repeat-containing protein [Planctomycetaceae bacterium]